MKCDVKLKRGFIGSLVIAGLAGCGANPDWDETPQFATQGEALSERNAVPVMTGNASSDGFVQASGTYSSGYESWHAFDEANTMWISEVWETPAWISYTWANGGRRITSYAIHYVNGSITTRAPRDWTLEGLNGATWEVVDRRTGETNWSGNERRQYPVQWPGTYSSYRLNVMDDNDTREGVVVISIGRLELFEEGVRSCAPVSQADEFNQELGALTLDASCGGSFDSTYSGKGYYAYPDKSVTFGCGGSVTLYADSVEVPNRFAIYRGNEQVASTGWIGYSTTSGPWGNSLSGPATKAVTFNAAAGTSYSLRVETMVESTRDAWSARFSCSCPQPKPEPEGPSSGCSTCVTPPYGMKAWWTGDSNADEHLSALPGKLTGGAKVLASGHVEGALSFDGTGYLETPHSSTLDIGTGDLSLDMWVRTTDATGTKVLVDKRIENSTTTTGYVAYLINGALGFQLSTGRFYNYLSTAKIADGQWHFIAITVDRDQTDGMRFYVDGQLVYTANPTNRTGSLSNTSPLRIGSRSSSATGLFKGEIDELELFGRALTSREVSTLYEAGNSGKCK